MTNPYIPPLVQEFSSQYTSINKCKLPAIYHKIDWWELSDRGNSPLLIVDYGCGKYYATIQSLLAKKMGHRVYFNYLPVDPYWYPRYLISLESEVAKWRADYPNGQVVCICSNVLNVIKEDEIVQNIKKRLFRLASRTYFTVYEGDGTGFGKQTGSDQYQRNQKIKDYITPNSIETVRRGVLCLNHAAKDYILSAKEEEGRRKVEIWP